MSKIIDKTSDNVIGIRLSGKLSEEDYDCIEQRLHERLQQHGKLRLLIDMDDFEGWESLGALWEDLKLDVRHNNDIERLAMLGEKGWQRWMTLLSQPFVKGTMRYFDRKDLATAWVWLRHDKPA
jgi:universal stress protein A